MTTIPNLRDLGGIATVGGQVIAPRRLLRSGLPFDDDVVDDALDWPPAVVIDLRSAAEVEHRPTLSDVRRVHVPLLSSLAPDAQLDGTLVALYEAVLEAPAPLLVDVVREIADADGPVLIHCAAGKDRTGIAIALVLRLLGVERDAVVADYLATNDALAAIDERLTVVAGGSERRLALPPEYHQVVPAAIEAMLDRWDAHAGGAEGWLVSVGADADLAARLRRSLLIAG